MTASEDFDDYEALLAAVDSDHGETKDPIQEAAEAIMCNRRLTVQVHNGSSRLGELTFVEPWFDIDRTKQAFDLIGAMMPDGTTITAEED